MEIKQKLIPASNKTTRPGIPMKPTYITVHETANTAKGATASAHANLQFSGNSRTASWHYTIDETSIYQSIPDNEVSWHAGDGGSGTGNRKSLSLEICVNQDGNYEKAKANAIWLVQYLMAKHNIPISNVVPHKHWSGKDCPHQLLPHWGQFIATISKSNGTTTVTKPTTGKPYPGHPIKLGDHGSSVNDIQKKLGGLVIDGVYGPKTESAVKRFQKSKGLVADGIVGPRTWVALFK